MNTSSRVPGISRNSGWRAVDAEIADRRLLLQPQGGHVARISASLRQEIDQDIQAVEQGEESKSEFSSLARASIGLTSHPTRSEKMDEL